jgi:hypothetical protein
MYLHYKNYCFSLSNTIIFYQEKNKLYIYTSTSARKFKEPLRFYILLTNNEINKYLPLFLQKNNKYNKKSIIKLDKWIEKQKLNFWKESFYEAKGKLKIIGRGWKIIKYNNQLLIKLGYSHYLYFFLNPIFKHKLKKKKKKYYVFYSAFNNELNTLLNTFKIMRIPDTYTRKGIFHRTIKF